MQKCKLCLFPIQFKVVDLENSDKNLGPGETGELCVKGPQVGKGPQILCTLFLDTCQLPIFFFPLSPTLRS